MTDMFHSFYGIQRIGGDRNPNQRDTCLPLLKRFSRGIFCFCLTLAPAILITDPPNLSAAGFSEPGFVNATPDEQAAQNIAQIAARAQNDEDYALAAMQWEKLITEHPDASLVGKAHYNAGVCYVQLEDFKSAAAQLAAAIPKLADDIQQQPQAYLFLGFSQLRAGQKFNRQSDDASKKEANILLTTSTKTFEDLLRKFPEFTDADQAAYFQGNAFEELGRLEEAEKSYSKMMEYENQTFRFDGLFALANVNEQLGKYSVALQYYEKFRAAAAAEGGNPLLDEVNFHTAKTLIALAVADTNRNDATAAAENYRQAEQLLAGFAELDADEKSPDFPAMAVEARYQQAYCLTQLGQFEPAAKIYESIGAIEGSPFRTQALVYAGRSYVQAGNEPQAIENLKNAVASETPFAIEGAVSLSNLYLKGNKNQLAFDIADAWINKLPTHPLVPVLMSDRADAAYRIEDKRNQSPALYLEIANKYSQHSVAPSALYNAAYALLELNELDQAIATATRLEKDYPTSDFLPDTLEVKADALLLKQDAAAAEALFEQLIATYGDHEKVNRWHLRSTVAKFFQEKYQAIIDTLGPQLDSFAAANEANQIAEANHWLGASHFYLDQFEPAISRFEKSIAADKNWRSADETLLILLRAQLKTGKPELAAATIEKLKSNFPQSPLIGNAYYYLGENAYQAKQYESAFENFNAVVVQYGDSEFAPMALYNAAWSQLELEKFSEADVLFTKLIDQYPQHELAEKAKIGRGATRRKTGNMKDSIADLSEYLANNPTGTAKINALYELGLAQVAVEDWAAAVKTFETLLVDDSASKRADRYHYELAWALTNIEQPVASLKHFAAIAEQHPDSDVAAEANFHLGTAAYQTNDFPAAIAAYEKCVANESGAANVREKAYYKLGWAHYKQDQFESAGNYFTKQVDLFPDGELAADGKFMIAETEFRQKKYDAALAAYRVAKPAVDAATAIDPKIKWLTLLHGAQAANKVNNHEEALALATPLTTAEVDDSFKYDAWLELGTANEGRGESDKAAAAWSKAKLSNSATGARAACMMGDLLFKEKKFDDAITEFKLVNYRFGGEGTPDDIKPWVAYALYEAARCNFVQVNDASDDRRPALVAGAIKQFETLLENYPEDRLAPEAKKQLEKLKQL